MQKTRSFLQVALASLVLAAMGCTENTTPTHEGDGGHPGDTLDGGGDGDGDGGQADTTAKLADNVAGKACGSDTDCTGVNGQCVSSVGGVLGFGATATPGGYCSGDCRQDTDCGAGGVCSGAQLGMGSCRRGCSGDVDCSRSGYRCVEGLNLQIVSLPASCLPRPATDQLGDGIVGKACRSNTQCGDGHCADTIGGASGFGQTLGDVPAPGGYCTGACVEDKECGAHGKCVTFLPNEPGLCYLECGSTCDARDGYHCGSVIGGGSGNTGGGFAGGAGGIFGGGGSNQIPNVCVPKPVTDAGVPDAGPEAHEDAGADGGAEPDVERDAGDDAGSERDASADADT